MKDDDSGEQEEVTDVSTSEGEGEEASNEPTQIEEFDTVFDEEEDEGDGDVEVSGEELAAGEEGTRELGTEESSKVEAKGDEDGGEPVTEPEDTTKEPIKEPAAQSEQELEKAAAPESVDAALTHEDWLHQRQEWQQQTITTLAEVNYKMSDELIESLDENPQEVLPRLMARVYVDAVEGATSAIASFLPQAIQHAQMTTQRTDSDEARFYEAWPDLSKIDDHSVVHQLGVAYRQTNPAASIEDFIQQVGAMAMVSLKRAPTNGEGTEVLTVKPVTEPSPRPFTSAAGGSAPRTAGATETEVDPFDALTREFEKEDATY